MRAKPFNRRSLFAMAYHSCRLLPLAFLCISSLAAQSVDDTQLKQVIIFGRHSVRAPVADNSILNTLSVQQYPSFGVGAGILTANGAKLETILGNYYRQWLTKEGLLTGNDSVDAGFVYFRANTLERTIETAHRLAVGMLPAATVNVDSYAPTQSDPLFDPLGAGVAQLNQAKAVAAVQGRLGSNGGSLTSAYASELALTRSLLFNYPAGQTPVPPAPAGQLDVTAIPIKVTAADAPSVVNLGGMNMVGLAIDPFVMEYADGLPAADVGWGRLTDGGISQIERITNLGLDLEFRTPYLASLLSSNVASHVVRSLVQAATGNAAPGALANPNTKVIALNRLRHQPQRIRRPI